MARKRIALRQFWVWSSADDGGVYLSHDYRACDWQADADGMTPGDVARTARAHARECDGKPQPRPERQPFLISPLITEAWSESIAAALHTSLIYGQERAEASL